MVNGVGINGLAGRIGKFAAYELTRLGIPVLAGNDLASTAEIADSLSHRDSVHGNLDWKVEQVDENTIRINDTKVRISHKSDPWDIIWGKDIKVVGECAGPFIEETAAARHYVNNYDLENVIISAPGKGDMKSLVFGVNHTEYVPIDDMIISNASCTTKALAMPMKALLDAGIIIYAVLMDTTHAVTNSSKPADFMSDYGALNNIISAKTGAAIATGDVIPYLKGKMDGFAMRVPTTDGSFANVYFVAEGKDLSVEHINGILKKAETDQRYCGRIVTFNGTEIASPDVIGNTASSVMALKKTKSIPLPFPGKENPSNATALIGIVSGYDNERGPAKDLALLTQYILRQY